MFHEKKAKTVYVAMSGGVDSSVAAALLKKQGFSVVGIFFKPWSPKLETRNWKLETSFCAWQQDRQDAMRVCAKLGIPFKTWDFSREYGKEVTQYMIDGYRAGITPNPDVMCNKEIKFGLFLKKALTEGADYIATGHYARIAVSGERLASRVKNKKLNARCHTLYTGIDKNKDQSYFLWTLTQGQLKHCLFPIGDYIKPEVRKMAKKFGLPNHAKKDSQGVCFVGPLNMKEFLKNYIKPRTGEIRILPPNYDRDKMEVIGGGKNKIIPGKIIGYHDGAYYYTIGQRHGLDIRDGQGPYFVVGKDVKKNILYVSRGSLFTYQAYARYVNNRNIVTVENVSWVGEQPKLPLDCQVKIRYRSESIPAKILSTKSWRGSLANYIGKRPALYLIKFKKSAKALTPGQSAVFYRGEEVLGGGIITEQMPQLF